jgi:selenide, water dikinase
VQVLRRLPKQTDPNLLVGSNTADDAGVYRIDRDRALVQTVDFFTPIVDDPYVYGQIAAVNALSDVYAMGGRPITAMNLLAVPTDLVSPEMIARILQGGGSKVRQARCAMVGGHSIRNPEPIYGLSVTGLVSPRRMIVNSRARPGDLLVLTKPLGTGIVSTGTKRGLGSAALARKAIRSMTTLNAVGTDLADLGLVRAGVDVTGFGFLGHLGSMCRASGVGAEIDVSAIPLLGAELFDLINQGAVPGGTRNNLEFANEFVEWDGVSEAHQILLADAQTSGGLLLCVPRRNLAVVLDILKKRRCLSRAVVGRIERSTKSRIRVSEGT